ncbi:MAG: biotin/lipoyl-binding protein, partial [Anaerolineae bacterium]
MNMRKFLLLALALFLTACAPRAATPTIPPITFSAAQPTPRPEGGEGGGRGVSASATVVPVRQVRLSFPFVGRVAEVLVEEGDEVTTGQALVTLDTTLLEARLAQAQAVLASAETQVRYLRRVGTGQEHLDAAQAEVERAQAAVAAAEATLEQATLVAPFDGTVVT